MLVTLIALLALQASPLLPDEGRVVNLGRDASITLPSEWTIDDGVVHIENVVYSLRRRDSTKVALRISLIGSTHREDIGQHPKTVCVNGLHGVTTVQDGIQRILLELPMPPRPGAVDYEALFVFSASDKAAQRIAESFRFRRTCALLAMSQSAIGCRCRESGEPRNEPFV